MTQWFLYQHIHVINLVYTRATVRDVQNVPTDSEIDTQNLVYRYIQTNCNDIKFISFQEMAIIILDSSYIPRTEYVQESGYIPGSGYSIKQF